MWVIFGLIYGFNGNDLFIYGRCHPPNQLFDGKNGKLLEDSSPRLTAKVELWRDRKYTFHTGFVKDIIV